MREKDVKKYIYIYIYIYIYVHVCFYASKNSEIMQRNFNPCRIEEITRT